jgi:hypothetical protein
MAVVTGTGQLSVGFNQVPNTFIHGYKGKFLIGSTDFAVTDFNLDWEVDDADITHTGAGAPRSSSTASSGSRGRSTSSTTRRTSRPWRPSR